MKVSVVVTVLNGGESVVELVRALGTQSRKPDEVIVVDGGSVDGTVEVLQSIRYKVQSEKVNLRVYTKRGCNIAQGRNWAIKKAVGEIIAVTDAGCVPEREWLARLVLPIEEGRAEVAAGFYRMMGGNNFQKAVALYLGVVPERLDEKSFLPSSRSVAFTKAIWRKAGGYPEKLSLTAEDTVFNLRLIGVGARFETVPRAVVAWELPRDLGEAAKKFYRYARGDGEAGIWWHPVQKWRTHLIKITLVFARYVAMLAVFIFSFRLGSLGFLAYGLWIFWKNRSVVEGKAMWWAPVIQIVADFGVMGGAGVGLLLRARNRLGKEIV